MNRRGRFEWMNDGLEVSVILVVFTLVYGAIGVGAIWTLLRSGSRRLTRSGPAT